MIWIARCMTLISVSINLESVLTREPLWGLSLLAVLVVLLVQLALERSRRVSQELRRQFKWAAAASTPDPITALAQFDYMDSLPPRRRHKVLHYLAHPPDEEVAWEDVPPDVRRFFEIAMAPPSER